jgi:hypothetical protein
VEWQTGVDITPNTGSKSQKKRVAPSKPSYTPAVVLGVLTVAFACFLVSQHSSLTVGQIGQPKKQQAVYDVSNVLQVAHIKVNAAGFNPLNTEFQAGGMIKAIFDAVPDSANSLVLVSKELNFNTPVQAGENMFLLNKPQTCTYELQLNRGTSNTTFTIKETVRIRLLRNGLEQVAFKRSERLRLLQLVNKIGNPVELILNSLGTM